MLERSFLALAPHGFYRLAYAEWGASAGRTIVCVHGLTRNGRDFDPLAAALAPYGRVICPDMPGRGRSGLLGEAADYAYPTYVAAAAALLARLGADEVDWVGTSMGGIIGMFLAAMPGSPIRRLVLNDIGAVIAADGLKRLGTYVGRDASFADLDALEKALRRIAATFGPLTDAQWRHLARHSAWTRAGPRHARAGVDYDAQHRRDAFQGGEARDVDRRATWDAITSADAAAARRR